MPNTSKLTKKLFEKALAVKTGSLSKNKVSDNVLEIANMMSEEELEKYSKEDFDMQEVTTSSSSGSYETPFPMKKRKLSEMNPEELTEFTQRIAKKAIISELFNTPKSAKKQAFSKGAPKSNKNSTSGVDSAGKDNIKDERKNKKVDKKAAERKRIESYQNGMQDTEYDAISEEQAENFKELALGKKDGKSYDKNKEMLDDAVKRKTSKDKASIVNKTTQLGDDIEYTPESKSGKGGNKKLRKKNAYESVKGKSIKRVKYKKTFLSEQDMLKKIPNQLKVDGNLFEMYDGQSKYLIEWSALENGKGGIGLIREADTSKLFENENKKMDYLSSYKNTESKTVKISEEMNVMKMIKESFK